MALKLNLGCEDEATLECSYQVLSGEARACYVITNALQAYYYTSANPTHIDIPLIGKAATGCIPGPAPDGVTYTFVVYGCGCKKICVLGPCNTPTCTLSASIVGSNVVANWSYNSSVALASATLNGVSILDHPTNDSGTVSYPYGSVPSVLTLSLVSSCGKTATCVVNIPCCWSKSRARFSYSGVADLNISCSRGPVAGNPGSQYIYIYSQVSELKITGLAAVNGTYIYNTVGIGSCTLPSTLVLIGTVNYYERMYYDVDQLLGGGTIVRRERQYEFQGDCQLYLDSANGSLFIRQPSAGMRSWGFRKANGVHENFPPVTFSPFDVQVCFGPPTSCTNSNPPCPVCNIGITVGTASIACGSVLASNLVFATGYRQLREAETNGFACTFPSSINNGTITTEYLT